MIDFLDMDNNKMVISEFYENDTAGKYKYDAAYQREKVWSEEKKSFLIDSILKNYPIPPIFLRLKIDKNTGTTTYDVIDGKQRLTTIRDFIEGKIQLPDDFGDDVIGNSELNGAYFSDLDNYEKYKRQFWRYRIPIIFIETDDENVIKSVFDRLNRNGEPLVPQELRHAKYGETKFYNDIKEVEKQFCWRNIFNEILEVERMENYEFLSELMFVIVNKKVGEYTKVTLDNLYEQCEKDFPDKYKRQVIDVSDYIKNMNLDYDNLKLMKVGHLYAIWVVAYLAYREKIKVEQLSSALKEFYQNYLLNKNYDQYTIAYNASMSAGTKGRSSRMKRINALINYCKSVNIQLQNDL